VKPVVLTDFLTKKHMAMDSSSTARVPVACGLFRFLDIEIEKAL